MYGSALTIVTVRPRASSSAPIDADATPLPSEETTPPVTKMNLVFVASLLMPSLHHPEVRGANLPFAPVRAPPAAACSDGRRPLPRPPHPNAPPRALPTLVAPALNRPE